MVFTREEEEIVQCARNGGLGGASNRVGSHVRAESCGLIIERMLTPWLSGRKEIFGAEQDKVSGHGCLFKLFPNGVEECDCLVVGEDAPEFWRMAV